MSWIIYTVAIASLTFALGVVILACYKGKEFSNNFFVSLTALVA